MKSLIKTLPMVVLGLMVSITSCIDNDDPVTPDPELQLVGTGNDSENGITANIYSNTELHDGYNEVVIELTNDESPMDAEISVIPMMQMTEMKHSAPVDYLYSEKDENGRYSVGVVFVMPSGEMGSWTIEVKYLNDGSESMIVVPVTVAPAEESRMFSFVSESTGQKIFVSLVEPFTPEVGVNDFELLINERKGMMDWPFVENLTVTIEPEMPTMGHGSPNNINPSYMEEGHYGGKVNFTMDGYWKIYVKIFSEDTLLGEGAIDVTFSEK